VKLLFFVQKFPARSNFLVPVQKQSGFSQVGVDTQDNVERAYSIVNGLNNIRAIRNNQVST